MKIDPQTNAERQAARKNRQLEQHYPLLHHAGILDQLVERWTAERHLVLQAACREALAASMSAAQAQAFASTELYMEVCVELTDEDQMRAWTVRCNTASFPKRPYYTQIFGTNASRTRWASPSRAPVAGFGCVGSTNRAAVAKRPTSWTGIVLGVARRLLIHRRRSSFMVVTFGVDVCSIH